MELSVITNYDVIPRHWLVSDFPSRGNSNSRCWCYRPKRVIRHKLRRNFISLHGATMRIGNQIPSLNEPANEEGKFEISKSGFIEVIAIGGRKDAVVEFCLDSPFSSTSLRFWNIVVDAESNGQLQQRFIGTDVKPNVVEVADLIKSSPKAVILVAGSGYGQDHIVAIDILRKIRSVKRFSVAITLKPFNFEGQRRSDEVSTLVGDLQEYTSFCIDIDGNMLLNKELVTLDEALQIVNSSVILAINMVSALFCERHRKLIDVPHSHVRELKDSEIVNIFQGYKEAKVGFGGGSDIRTSVSQAIYGCPFINAEDLDGLFICGVASSEVINDFDVQGFWHDFRQTADHAREIITYLIHEPSLEQGMIVATVIIFGSGKQEASEKSSAQKQPSEIMNLFSKLAQQFAVFSNFVKGNHSQLLRCNGSVVQDACASMVNAKSDYIEAANITGRKGVVEEMRDDFDSSRLQDGGSEVAPWDGKSESDCRFEEYMDGPPFKQEALDSWTTGPGHHMAESWAKERASKSGAALAFDNIGICCLPVGIRPSDDLKDGVGAPSANECTGPGFWEGYSSAPAIMKTNPGFSKKQRVLSARAASMLEAERDSPKKWTPTVKIQYRGGAYEGKCQGGLPEGKGRLVLGDGSIYDGMWRNGKRSGLGTFYFSNGDVFQGSWREDLIHGKGWFYFHTGDRWFANFWKGKASGEGRFYSKAGDVFFGNFECGWRHGQFLCIYVDGTRWIEIWSDGVLVSRKQLDNAQ